MKCLPQSIFFYVPRFLWKHWEGGKLMFLMEKLPWNMDEFEIMVSYNLREKLFATRKKRFVQYLEENLPYQNWWGLKYIFCEALSFLNLLGKKQLSLRLWNL